MLVQSVPLAILCFGLVCVIAVGGDDVVSGGIDLSLPATAVLGVALLSLGLAEWHTPYLLLLALLAAVCLLCGAINGLLVLAAGLPLLLETVLATFIGAAFSRRRVVTIWGALLGAILVNALSNGLGLLGVNIFWMGAIKGGLILVVLAASAVRHKGGEA